MVSPHRAQVTAVDDVIPAKSDTPPAAAAEWQVANKLTSAMADDDVTVGKFVDIELMFARLLDDVTNDVDTPAGMSSVHKSVDVPSALAGGDMALS